MGFDYSKHMVMGMHGANVPVRRGVEWGRSPSRINPPILSTVMTVAGLVLVGIWIIWSAFGGVGSGAPSVRHELQIQLEQCRRAGLGDCRIETDSDGTQSVYGR